MLCHRAAAGVRLGMGRRGLAAVHETVRLSFSDEPAPEGVPPDRAPLVIMHGLLGSKQNWRSLSRSMAHKLQRRVIALDLRNHGTSPHMNDASYEAMAKDVQRFIFEQQIPAPCLLGHSMVRFWRNMVQRLNRRHREARWQCTLP